MNTYDLEARLRDAMRDEDWGTVERVMVALDLAEPPPRPVNLLGSALWYAEHGLHVFPLAPLSKIPRKGSAGFTDATTDAATIRAWWKAEPRANIGIATGQLVDVIDFDGALGHTSWTAAGLTSLTPGMPLLATVSTPRPGGLHAYVPASGQGNAAGSIPGVDYRGLGGYVVAPPSHTDKGSYRFLKGFRQNMEPYT